MLTFYTDFLPDVEVRYYTGEYLFWLINVILAINILIILVDIFF